MVLLAKVEDFLHGFFVTKSCYVMKGLAISRSELG